MFWNKKKKADKTSRVLVASAQMGTAHWTPWNYANFIKETYMKNVVAFRCMFMIGQAMGVPKWALFKKRDTEREEITDHQINYLLKRPNPEDSFGFLTMKWVIYLLANGNSFFERVAPTSGTNKEIPKELYVLRPDKIKIETGEITGKIKRYVYDQKIFFDVDPLTRHSDLLHIKLFHPLNDFWGMSITEPTAKEIDTSNEATNWQKKIIENEARPGMVYTIKGYLDDEQWDRLENQLRELKSGSNNAGKNIIIESEGGASVTPYAWSPKELDWIESNREMARKICWGYGVPPMLLGIPGDNTYSNYQEARMAFWEDTIIFYLTLLREEMNNWIFSGKDEGLFLDFNLDNIPALAPKRKMLWERAEGSSFLTINEKREMVGLEKHSEGDVILVPAMMTPLGDSFNVEEEEDSQEEDEKALKKLTSDLGLSEEDAGELIGLPPEKGKD